jgi:hypothetical protein
MEEGQKKPKLVFFQWKHDLLPMFLQLHMQLHVKCLSEFFDVVLINEHCDYQQVCDKYQPELTLFESGFRSKISHKLNIKNTSAYPQIPKLGLHNGDSWCDCRAGFISDMEYWGIETFFSISTTTAEHTPEIAKNLFVWPNFIDSDIYHDYHQSKVVPVLFTGLMNSLYPWRQKMYKIISNHYELLALSHSGYKNYSTKMFQGEQYARAINSSWFVPTCGTIAKEVVRKHFEIPGSRACLLTEKAPSLEAAGFVDMQNCVFADENNVLDKLEYLFENTNELTRIINGGYELVQNNHTLKQRDQIYQWFNLKKKLKHDEIIVQLNPFHPLKIVTQSSRIKTKPIICNGLHLELLRQGDENLWAGKYDEAEALYLKCLDYIDWMCEPKLKLTLCNLFKGNAHTAFRWISGPLMNNFRVYKAFEPDPIEWAYFIVSLLCRGKLEEAMIRSKQFPLLHHPELDYVRCAISCIQNKVDKLIHLSCKQVKSRSSIHQLPQRSLGDWINFLCVLLKACQQHSYANILRSAVYKNEVMPEKPLGVKSGLLRLFRTYFIRIRILCSERISRVFKISYVQNPRHGLPPISQFEYFIQIGGNAKIELIKRVFQYYANLMIVRSKLFILFQRDEKKKESTFLDSINVKIR